MRWQLILIISLAPVCALLTGHAPAEDAAPFTVVENRNGATVLEGTRPVLTYQRSPRSQEGRWPRADYVHPLYDLDGEVFTEDFPEDHGHHRGIFWAWHQVTVDGQRMGDAWVCQDFVWDVVNLDCHVTDDQAILKATTLWRSPDYQADNGALVAFVEEQATITVYPQREIYRSIDFDIRLTALVEGVQIGGSEDRKGYGGFSPRIKLTGKEIFLSNEGEVEPQVMQLEAGPWLDISTQERGLTILTHPTNPGFPQPWILRRSRSMQNPAYPGREPVTLSTASPLVLRYRLIVHRGDLPNQKIESLQEAYAEH